MYLDFFKNVIKDASVSGIESKLLFIQFLAFRLINYCYTESLDDIYIYNNLILYSIYLYSISYILYIYNNLIFSFLSPDE